MSANTPQANVENASSERVLELALVDAAAELLKRTARLEFNLRDVVKLSGDGELSKAADCSNPALTLARLQAAKSAVLEARESIEFLLYGQGLGKAANSTNDPAQRSTGLGTALKKALRRGWQDQ